MMIVLETEGVSFALGCRIQYWFMNYAGRVLVVNVEHTTFELSDVKCMLSWISFSTSSVHATTKTRLSFNVRHTI